MNNGTLEGAVIECPEFPQSYGFVQGNVGSPVNGKYQYLMSAVTANGDSKVSNCYIKEVAHVWKECARVLKKGGILMAGLDNGTNYLFKEEDESHVVNTLPFDPLANEEQMRLLAEEDCGVQFSHSISEQIADQIKVGLELLDVYDDTNGSGFLHEHGVPCFWATLARKK